MFGRYRIRLSFVFGFDKSESIDQPWRMLLCVFYDTTNETLNTLTQVKRQFAAQGGISITYKHFVYAVLP